MSAASFAAQRAAFDQGRLLRVVNWHSIPAGAERELERTLTAYLERYDAVTLADLDTWYGTGAWPTSRPAFLPAFYDGYRSSATVAAKVCDALGVRALFLAPTAFLSAPVEDQLAFAATHDIDLTPGEDSGRLAMTWEELGGVAERHDVGGHTATHCQREDVRTAGDARREVHEPLDLLERRTGQRPTAWAWLAGAPFEPGTAAGRALLDAGVRYVLSNTAVERIQ